MKIIHIFLLILLLHAPLQSAWAAEAITSPTITRMIGDVNIFRDKQFVRANHGFTLRRGDEIRTGHRGKAYIDFPDGSRVKLGSWSRFQVRDWSESDGVFSAILRASQGAFRYTANFLRQGLKQRNIELTTRTAVLGVRGTDFWGRTGKDNTFLLLLEGSVSLAPRFGDSTTFNQAGAAVNIDNKRISTPKMLAMDAVLPLAAETEISSR